MSNFGNWQQDLSSSFPSSSSSSSYIAFKYIFFKFVSGKGLPSCPRFYFTVLYSDPAAPYDREMPDLNLGPLLRRMLRYKLFSIQKESDCDLYTLYCTVYIFVQSKKKTFMLHKYYISGDIFLSYSPIN